jgi:hypothetical protein
MSCALSLIIVLIFYRDEEVVFVVSSHLIHATTKEIDRYPTSHAIHLRGQLCSPVLGRLMPHYPPETVDLQHHIFLLIVQITQSMDPDSWIFA